MKPMTPHDLSALHRAGQLSESAWRRYQADLSDPRRHRFVPEKWRETCYRCGQEEAAHHGRLWNLLRWAGLLAGGCLLWWCAFQAVA